MNKVEIISAVDLVFSRLTRLTFSPFPPDAEWIFRHSGRIVNVFKYLQSVRFADFAGVWKLQSLDFFLKKYSRQATL